MKQFDVDLLLAKAQVGFAALMLVGVFALIFVLIFFHGDMSTTAVTIITSVITALVTILTLMMNFFYARSRPAALPEPPASTTATTTQADGSTATVTTSPLPQPSETKS